MSDGTEPRPVLQPPVTILMNIDGSITVRRRVDQVSLFRNAADLAVDWAAQASAADEWSRQAISASDCLDRIHAELGRDHNNQHHLESEISKILQEFSSGK